MAKITLSTIKSAVEAKFGSYVIDLEDGHDPVELLHPIRLSDAKRLELTEVAGSDDDDEADEGDVVERFTQILETVTATEAQHQRLLQALSPNGHIDLGILTEVVQGYLEDQRVGEASPSQD